MKKLFFTMILLTCSCREIVNLRDDKIIGKNLYSSSDSSICYYILEKNWFLGIKEIIAPCSCFDVGDSINKYLK